MKVIIAGSRTGVHIKHVIDAIKHATQKESFTITEVVSGGARGVDKMGESLAQEHNVRVRLFPAKWSDLTVSRCIIKSNLHGKYNALAGHNRNTDMANYADGLIAVWDGASAGTANMINTMRKLGKKVYVYKVNQSPVKLNDLF